MEVLDGITMRVILFNFWVRFDDISEYDRRIPLKISLKQFFLSLFFFSDPKLVSEDDPENVKHEFAFDNPAFKSKFFQLLDC